MNRRILVFVKAPVPGFVKTRLTPAVTPERAAELSKVMALDTWDVVRHVPDAGGYYVIVLQRPQPALFQSIRWSEPTVLEQTVNRLKEHHLNYNLLPRRVDLDTPEDLRRLRADPALVALGFQRTLAVLQTLS